jgi:hypothetical protein
MNTPKNELTKKQNRESTRDSPLEEIMDALTVAREETLAAKFELNKVIAWSEGERQRLEYEIVELKKDLVDANFDLDVRIHEIATAAVKAAVLAAATDPNAVSIDQVKLNTYDLMLKTPVQKNIVTDIPHPPPPQGPPPARGVQVVELFPAFCC